MPKLTVIVGLPGSGKTTYIKRLSIPGVIADDFMARAHGPRFTDARQFLDLIRALKEGKDSLVCDITLCRPGPRADFESTIRAAVPTVTIEWQYFANDPEACLANVRRRVRLNITREEDCIRDLAPRYEIPPGASTISVWRPA